MTKDELILRFKEDHTWTDDYGITWIEEQGFNDDGGIHESIKKLVDQAYDLGATSERERIYAVIRAIPGFSKDFIKYLESKLKEK